MHRYFDRFEAPQTCAYVLGVEEKARACSKPAPGADESAVSCTVAHGGVFRAASRKGARHHIGRYIQLPSKAGSRDRNFFPFLR